MFVEHNPVFVKPTLVNLLKLRLKDVVVRLKNGRELSSPTLYFDIKDIKDGILLFKWAHSSEFVTVEKIEGIAPRHYDTIEELEADK